MEIMVSSAFGLEAVVKREMIKLGLENPKAIDGKVRAVGTMEDVMRLNVCLRSGDRVLIKLAEFRAVTFEELFQNVKQIPFENYIKSDAKILMDGNSVKSILGAIKVSGGVIKKSIVDRLSGYYKCELKEDGERVIVVFNIVNDIVTISLDTSGDGLHKRGYRVMNYTAPLKETLAAGLIQLSVYNKEKPFADIFCGSGTIPIEACLYALNIAPNKHRTFDFMHFVGYDENLFKKVVQEAESKEVKDFMPKIYACDINPEAIKLAKLHAKLMGVDKYITFELKDMREFKSDEEFGVIISNPPYGDRIGDKATIGELYADFGKVFKKLPNWNCYCLTDNMATEKHFGRSADKTRKLYNANIECKYYSFMSKSKPAKDITI